MKVRFLGAARTVTGSCYLLETEQYRFAVDCGLHQGNQEIDARNWDLSLYTPAELDFMLVTHAHIDHTGLLPRLVKLGFSGPVYATEPTCGLMEIMLQDSAHIQEMEAQWRNRKRLRHGGKQREPLYARQDAEAVFPLLRPQAYNEMFEPVPGLRVNFKDAGHILGSSFIEIWVDSEAQRTKLVFSGDLGRPNQLIVREPSIVETADYLFMESTYGDRNHKDEDTSREELAEAIGYSYGHGEKVIIPAFAVERTQEIIYTLYLLHKEGKLPPDMPVYVDSPLATKATEVFRRNPEFFDRTTRELLENGEDPFGLPQLTFTQSTEESKALNTLSGPAVVISASGMANAGRIKHHLRHNLWRRGASVVFVGFQAKGTTGRKIVDGAETVRIFGEEVAVGARVYTINGFSAHAGQQQILDWLGHFRTNGMQVFLVHGEYQAQQTLAELIEGQYGLRVAIPDYLEEITLHPGGESECDTSLQQRLPQVDWDWLIQQAQTQLDELHSRQTQLARHPMEEQWEIRDRLQEITSQLTKLISGLANT